MTERLSLRPERALLHPVWVGALALLALNDQVLKHAAAVPSALTGKLSDVVGLVVAPVLLAVLCGCRTRRGLLAAHLAVGLGFAAINVSPAAAGAVEALTAHGPWPWFVTVDPTDLLALPALALGWWALIPVMARPLSVRPLAGAAFGTVGMAVCLATSPPPPGPDPGPTTPVFPTQWGNAAIANAAGADLTLRIRPLREDVYLDCSYVRDNPTSTLARALFDPAQLWVAEVNRAIPLPLDGNALEEGSCAAWLVDGNGVPMRLVFLDGNSFPPEEIPTTLDELHPSRAILVGADGVMEGPGVYSAPPLEPAPIDAGCAIDPADGLAWTVPSPTAGTIEAVIEGGDGCFAVDLVDGVLSGRFFLCFPTELFPFELGDEVVVNVHSSPEMLTVTGSDGRRISLAVGSEPVPALALGSWTPLPRTGCAAFHDACGNLHSPIDLAVEDVDGAQGSLSLGEAFTFSDGSSLHLVDATEIPVGDLACLPASLDAELLVQTILVQPGESR